MKKIIILLIAASFSSSIGAQKKSVTKNSEKMKLNAGIVTDKFTETKEFYTKVLDFGVTFENEFYLLLHTPDHEAQLSFLLPNHPTQQPLFHKPFRGEGMYLTIEVEDIDALYSKVKESGTTIALDIRDEPWGDRHFAIVDPNGIGIDLVRYTAPEEE